MNKNGFTLIELITTFALATVIIVLLINVVSIIKNIYTQNSIKSKLTIEQSNLSKLMNEAFDGQLESYSVCDDSNYCFNFVFDDGDTHKLIINSDKIKFDNYVYDLDSNAKVVNPILNRQYVDYNDETNLDNFFKLKIPIISKLYPEKDFGVDIVFKGPTPDSNEDSGSDDEVVTKSPCTLIFGNKDTTGSMYSCNVNNILKDETGSDYTFYVLSTNLDGTTNLILDRNINSDGTLSISGISKDTTKNGVYNLVEWVSKEDYNDDVNYGTNGNNDKGPITAMNFLYNATKNWTNIPNIQMNYTDEGSIGSYGYGKIVTTNNITKITMKDGTAVTVLIDQTGYTNLKARMPYLREVSNYNGSNRYLYEYLNLDSNQEYTPTYEASNIHGYWTLSSSLNLSAMIVSADAVVSGATVSSFSIVGVRPVITVKLDQ